MKIKIFLLLFALFIGSASVAQFGGVKPSEPPTIITKDGSYARLGKQKRGLSGTYRWYYYQSDSLGQLTWLKWRLADYWAADSATAVSSLPSGFALYDLPCQNTDGFLWAIWNVTGDTLKVERFNDAFWIVQQLSVTPHEFIVRGKNMVGSQDVTILNALDSVCLASLANTETGIGGLEPPLNFATPSGYQSYVASDGVTIIYTNSTDIINPDNVACEDIGNPHSLSTESMDRNHHHYANVAEGKLVGNGFTEYGQILVADTWHNYYTLGYDPDGRRYAGYKVDYVSGMEGNYIATTRTKPGCEPPYEDNKTLEYFTYNVNYKQTVSIPGNSTVANLNLQAIKLAGGTPKADGYADVYELYTPGFNTNQSIRINGGTWNAGVNFELGPSTEKLQVTRFIVNSFGGITKDFRLDISNNAGTTYDTYIVRRTGTGGHYASVCTFQRVTDGRTYVSTTLGSDVVPAQLVISGITYDKAFFGDCFDLGNQSGDKTAVFKFQQTGVTWATLNLLIDENQTVQPPVPVYDLNPAITFSVSTSGSSVSVSGITGGTSPYKVGVIGFKSPGTETTINNLPNGFVRVYIIDNSGKRSFQKLVAVNNPSYSWTNKINWDLMSPVSFSSNVNLIYGWGSPVWSGEAANTDAIRYGFTANGNTQFIPVPNLDPTLREGASYFDNTGAIPYMNNAANQIGATGAVISGNALSNWPSVSYSQKVALGNSYYYFATTRQDPSGTYYRPRWIFFDEEFLANNDETADYNAALSRGVVTTNTGYTHKIVYYGKLMSASKLYGYSGLSTGNWKETYFPFMSTTDRNNIFIGSNYMNYIDGNVGNQFVDVMNGYFKVPFPMSNSKYQKSGSSFILDPDGERKFREDEFTEVQRGRTIQWDNTPRPGQTGIVANPGYYTGNQVPELWWGVNEFYMIASKYIAQTVALHNKLYGNADIYSNPISTMNVRPMPVIRDETEEDTFPDYSQIPRPISDYQAEFQALFSLAVCDGYYMWSNYGNILAGQERAKNSGQYFSPFLNSNTNYFGGIERMAITNFEVAKLNETYGILEPSAKKAIFYMPADISHEIIAAGTINANKVWVVASEPRLDCDESMNVTLTNTVNAYTQTFTVKGCQNFSEVFVLPAGSYPANTIRLQYNDIYGALHKVTGDLRSHTW